MRLMHVGHFDSMHDLSFRQARKVYALVEDARKKQKDFRKRIINALVPTPLIVNQAADVVHGTMVGVVIDRIG